MSYEGSYVWRVRQRAGDLKLLTATVDVLPVDNEGRVKLVYPEHVQGWSVVGGHVEEGDSWRSAALNELREEAGIVAQRENLVPWATISGPGRVFHYRDGDSQAFTLIFLVRKWESEGVQEDGEEITETGWFGVDEALQMEVTPWSKKILLAYKKYLETREFQMMEEEG